MNTFTFSLRQIELASDEHGWAEWQVNERTVTIACAKVAIVVCDMWDNHWSRGAAERVNAMVPRMNHVLMVARERGATILHAPSETMSFYVDSPARQRMASIAQTALPHPITRPEIPLPIDASDGGSDTGETVMVKAWSRQHPAVEIDETRDGISDNGEEIVRFIAQQQIEQVLIMGVHTNMCVLNRSFGTKQMVRWGVPIALVRDLTDTMYNPAMPPYVSHDAGTQLIIGYIEKFWCPSVDSQQILDQHAHSS